MTVRESGEMYLETIYILLKKTNDVRSMDIAEYMNFSKPSVSVAMKKLRENGYIHMDDQSHISLTESGLEIANTMYERHVMLTNWLIYLGMNPKTAAADACRMEHVVSAESFAAIKRHMTTFF